MKIIRILAALLALASAPAIAQVTPGSGPTTVAKGGTGQSSLSAHYLMFGAGISPVTLYGCTGFLVGTGTSVDPTCRGLLGADLPNPGASSKGGVQSLTCSASNWLNALTTGGVLNCLQPNFTDLAGAASLSQLPAFSGMSSASAAADTDTFPTNQGAGNLKQTLAAVKTWVKAWIAKADVGLGNVDNTSDVTKNAATVALTNKDLTSGTNIFPTLNQNTTGSAAKWTTARLIDGQSLDGTANITVIAPGTHAASSKTTPVDADEIPLVDSAASNVLAKLTWANLKATVKTYYDSLATTLTNKILNCANNTCTVRIASDVSGLGTSVSTALGTAVGSAGGPVVNGGALGTPSSGVGTNLTGTASGLTAGNVTTNANLTGDVTSVGNATTLTNAPVIAKLLTAFSPAAGTVSSSDSILGAFQKVVGNIALKADALNSVLTGLSDIQGGLKLSGVISPTQIAANTNDYAPTSFSTASTLRISTDASRNITGLAGGAEGRTIIIHNVGAFAAVLTNQDTGSIAANRFLFGGDMTLGADTSVTIRYDGTSNRWRAITTPGAGGGGGGGVSSVGITASAGVDKSGTCTITTSGSCDIHLADDYRRNSLLTDIYQAKAFGAARNKINELALGFVASTDINSGSSTNASLNLGSGYLSPSAATPSTTTVASATLASNSTETQTRRQLIAAAQLSGSGSYARVTFEASSGANLVINNAYIGQGASSGNAYSFQSAPVRLTFNGGSNSVTIPTGTSVTSDIVTFTLDNTKPLVVSYYQGASSAVRYLGSKTGWTAYNNAGGGDDASTTTASGYASDASVVGVNKVETATGLAGFNNMTAVTVAQTVSSTVTTGRLLLEYDNTATPTLNTDLLGYVTCNGGTNWTSVTLSSAGIGQSGRLVAESAETTCSNSGTSIAGKIATANNKNIATYGATIVGR